MAKENKNEAHVTPSLLIWARKKAGLSIKDVAFKIEPIREGYRVFIENWELGQTKPTISQAQKLAEIYKVPFAAFFLPEPPKEPKLLTLREITSLVKERIKELNSDDPLDPIEALDAVRFELERLEERIEGIQAEHTGRSIKSIGANWACGVNWACKEILGKEGDMNDSRG